MNLTLLLFVKARHSLAIFGTCTLVGVPSMVGGCEEGRGWQRNGQLPGDRSGIQEDF